MNEPRAYYNEHDPYAAAWLENLIHAGEIAPGVVDTRSILDVQPSDLDGFTQCHFFAGIGIWSCALRSAGWPDDRPVWTGSCPCQPFSAAGAGLGFDDDRHLFPGWQWLIEQCRPQAVFGEQVASSDGLVWADLVQAAMEASGYACGFVDTCAAGFRSFHIRQRLYFAAEDLRSANGGVGNCGRTGPQGRHRENACAQRRKAAPRHTGPSSPVGVLAHATQLGQRQEYPHLCGLGSRDSAQGYAAGPSPSDVSERLEHTTSSRQHGRRTGKAVSQSPEAERLAGRGDAERVGDAGFKSSERHARTISEAEASSASARGSDGRHGDRYPDAGTSSGLAKSDKGECGRLADSKGRNLDGQEEGWQQSYCGTQSSGAPSGMAENDVHADPSDGYWRDADWLFCRDGRWRPVEPGTFPLAHACPARLGRLRAYGNGLDLAQATGFIRAYMERDMGDPRPTDLFDMMAML